MNQKSITWPALFALLLFTACTKIDTTTLGSELIPVVDNIKTFETTLPVVANSYIGAEEYRLSINNTHVVGGINNDPVFGNSKATMFFNMLPAAFPFTFAHADSLKGANVGFDSAVLILDYISYYGDSTAPVNLKLYQSASNINRDTSSLPYYNLDATGLAPDKSIFWGAATVQANQFKDSVSIKRGEKETGKVANQLRIRLNDALASAFFYDSASFKNDTIFREKYKGFALEADQPANTLLYFSLTGKSKIEFFYRAKPLSTVKDTTSASFTVNFLGGHAVNFERERAGAELENALVPDPVNGQEFLYIQSSPGTSAKIHIPGLDTFKLVNRVIHRAELRITAVENAQAQLAPPRGLYLDIIDTASNTYKGIPYDLNPYLPYYCYPASGINFDYFGGITRIEKVNNRNAAVYRFNIARYLQSVVTKGEPIYDFRLSAPFSFFYKNCANTTGSASLQVFPFVINSSATASTIINPPGSGRVKLAGSSTAVDPSVRMQLRIIYSTL